MQFNPYLPSWSLLSSCPEESWRVARAGIGKVSLDPETNPNIPPEGQYFDLRNASCNAGRSVVRMV